MAPRAIRPTRHSSCESAGIPRRVSSRRNFCSRLRARTPVRGSTPWLPSAREICPRPWPSAFFTAAGSLPPVKSSWRGRCSPSSERISHSACICAFFSSKRHACEEVVHALRNGSAGVLVREGHVEISERGQSYIITARTPARSGRGRRCPAWVPISCRTNRAGAPRPPPFGLTGVCLNFERTRQVDLGRAAPCLHGIRRRPSHLTRQLPSAGKPGAGPSGAPSQPAAIMATAASSPPLPGR